MESLYNIRQETSRYFFTQGAINQVNLGGLEGKEISDFESLQTLYAS